MDPNNALKILQASRSEQFKSFIGGVGGRGLEGAEMKLRQLEKRLTEKRGRTRLPT